MGFEPWTLNTSTMTLGPMSVVSGEPPPIGGLFQLGVDHHVLVAKSARFTNGGDDPKIIVGGGGGPCGATGTCPPVPPPPEVAGNRVVTLSIPSTAIGMSADTITFGAAGGPIVILAAANADAALTAAMTTLPLLGGAGQVFWMLELLSVSQWDGTLGHLNPIMSGPTGKFIAIPIE